MLNPASNSITPLPNRILALENFYLLRPSGEVVQEFVDGKSEAPLSYSQVGRTDTSPPHGWSWHEENVCLGSGVEAWERAKRALRSWSQFDLEWVHPHDRTVPLEVGQVFGFLSWQYGVWCLNVCRVVYVVDEQQGDRHRFGFAYGTVEPHAVRGEEQFMLEWNQETDEVRFYIRKFSKPRHFLVRMAGPLAQRTQARFTRDALRRFAQEVTE